MLFNSYPFIFLFLPVVLLGYFTSRPDRPLGAGDVAGAGVAGVLFGEQLALCAVAARLRRVQLPDRPALITQRLRAGPRLAVLAAGVAGDLLVLGYFKYAGFLAANLNALFATGLTLNILLPVGISFFTFTQIAFLVDA